MSVWFITGAARGFGAEITEAALRAGHAVVATARTPDAVTARFPDVGDNLQVLALDVTDPRSIELAVIAAVERFGRIDVLVNNAGHGVLGAVEEIGDEAARRTFDTNVFGVLNVQRAVLPVMRRQRSGHILQMSSVGGFRSAAGWGVYAATKFALEGFSEALADEVAPLGITVTIVEPGYFRTDFLDASSLLSTTAAITDYADTPAGAMRALAASVNHAQPGDPVAAAQVIVEVAALEHPPRRLPLGSDCIAAIEGKLEIVAQQIEDGRERAVLTDYAHAVGA